MYAIIKNGAHQYRVQAGQFIRIEKSPLEMGQDWKCEQVLVLKDAKDQIIMGTPYIQKAVVTGKIIRHGKGKKLLVFKKKRRKGYRRTQGHRQEFSEVYIESLCFASGEIEKKLLSSSKKTSDKTADSVNKVEKKENKVENKVI